MAGFAVVVSHQICHCGVGELKEYVIEELNVSELRTAHPDEFGSTLAVPNFQVLGKRLGKRMGAVGNAVKKLTPQQIAEFQKTGSITVEGETLGADEVRDFCSIVLGLSEFERVSCMWLASR